MNPAPDGLGLVQDFLNTASAGRPRQDDLLTDPARAAEWMHRALASWAEDDAAFVDVAGLQALTARDLQVLRRVRDGLIDALHARQIGADLSTGGRDNSAMDEVTKLQVGLEARLAADGTVRFAPVGRGWKLLIGPLALEIQRAKDADAWSRLKSCKNDRCRGVFYDRSRNNSGVWHDVRTCGNAANLKASRARRRAVRQSVEQ